MSRVGGVADTVNGADESRGVERSSDWEGREGLHAVAERAC